MRRKILIPVLLVVLTGSVAGRTGGFSQWQGVACWATVDDSGDDSDLRSRIIRDSAAVDISLIPKLSESFDLVDYKETFAGGTVFPDRVALDGKSVATGQRETAFNSFVADSAELDRACSLRTREQQWQFISELLWKNNYSMHYYILSEIYYRKQLSGEFCTYTRQINGVGQLRVHLHKKLTSDEQRTIWLIELVMEAVSEDAVAFKDPTGLTLIRSGDPIVEWDLNTNCLVIEPGNEAPVE